LCSSTKKSMLLYFCFMLAGPEFSIPLFYSASCVSHSSSRTF
jgi:hypothetical protein